MRAIVLSGGGAKGAYEAGAWKALKKLRIKYDIITGTSIGAINGMMMVQNDLYACLKLWKNINFGQLYDDFDYSDEKTIYKSYLDKIMEGGLDTHKIEKIINDIYKPHKIYNSKIAFGVVSYNITDKKAVFSTNRNTRPDRLKSHILASSTCYPAFKPTQIGTDKYIDGGYYDNLPLNLAVELGADEIIAVDLKAIGRKKSIKNKDIPITYIAPKTKLEPILMFESITARKMIKLGFNDTMKVFNKYEGNVYTFKKGTINRLSKKYKNKLNMLLNNYKISTKNNDFLDILEDSLSLLEIPVENLYNSMTCNKALINKISKIDDINLSELNSEELKKIFDRKVIVKYIYVKLKKCDKINNIILNLFPKETITALYLITIGS